MTAQRFTLLADPDRTHRDVDASIEHRDARMVDVGGSIDFRMTGGDPLVTAELLSIFNEFVDAEFAADIAARRAEHGDEVEIHDLLRAGKQRRHDAVVAILRSARAATKAGKTADPLVNIIVDAATFARVMTDAGLATDTDVNGEAVDPFTGLADNDDLLDRCCETTNGVTLHPHHVLRAALTGHIRRVVVDSAGVVIDQGRKQRVFTGSARSAAMLLVRHCEHPGCDLPAEWCQVDHAHEWFAGGGRTDQANARTRCGYHNGVKHRRRLRSRRAANGTTYTIRLTARSCCPWEPTHPTFSPATATTSTTAATPPMTDRRRTTTRRTSSV